MGKLDAALAWAARGFPVFPLQVNSKDPTDIGWTLQATTDPETIRRMWTDPVLGVERDNNVGFLTSGHIVPDVDVKAGKVGLATMADLGLDFDTLTTRTASGGYHLVYQGLDRPIGQSRLGLDVDLRSHNGYVVAPGSTLDLVEGGGFETIPLFKLSRKELNDRLAAGATIREAVPYVVELDLPIAEFPEHLRPRLREARRRAEGVRGGVEMDAPESIEVAAHYLLHDAPVAVEGLNGDDTTYRVVCRVRDYGVSEGAALELFLDEYNPRCEPPWSAAEARAKVENAYRYATGEPGSLSPAASFEGVVHVPLPAGATGGVTPPLDTSGIIRFGTMTFEEHIEPRQHVIEGVLMADVVTLLVAEGGSGKTLLSLIVAAHLAVGAGTCLGYRICRPGKSVVYNAEDSHDEISRRLNAICALYGFDREVVRDRIAIFTSEKLALQITESQPPRVKQDHMALLAAALADPEVVMFAADPLVEIHSGQENDSMDMRYVMGALRSLARVTKTPVLVIHHTGKPASSTSSMAGSQHAGRGSTSMAAAARIVLTLYPATEKECVTDLQVPAADGGRYVRLDGAKANFSERRMTPRWLRWETHLLANGDKVGVLREHDASAAYDAVTRAMARLFVDHLVAEGDASMLLEQAAQVLARRDPALATEEVEVLKNRIRRLFTVPVRVDEKTTVAFTVELEHGRKVARIVVR